VSAPKGTLSKSTAGPTRAGLVVFLSFDKIELGREEALTKDLELELTLPAHFILDFGFWILDIWW